MFWKDQPLNPVEGAFRSQWTGRDFVVYDSSDNVILRLRASDGKVVAALPAGAIDTAELADDAVTEAKIDDDAVTVTKMSGIGFSRDYASTSDGVDNLLAAVTGARYVLLTVQVIEVFADAGGAQPTFTIGDTSNATRFLAAAELTGAALSTRIPCGGIITTAEPLIVTATPAAGAGTGAIRVTAIAVQ